MYMQISNTNWHHQQDKYRNPKAFEVDLLEQAYLAGTS